ncbi:MAG: sulfatase-like hydrolase/transferase, partial [SAR324 cluster bacterium]|nr:sulfatase-like hydrolase/transferase [SAR324 cluster bacterium]
MVKNILFIMCDQLRADYLSCYGHPFINTPNIDKIAEMGVLFSHAYCQAPLCGPSRASFYTGRYLASHGAVANADPLKLGERSLGAYLQDLKYRTVLVGKSEVRSNQDALSSIQIDQHSEK